MKVVSRKIPLIWYNSNYEAFGISRKILKKYFLGTHSSKFILNKLLEVVTQIPGPERVNIFTLWNYFWVPFCKFLCLILRKQNEKENRQTNRFWIQMYVTALNIWVLYIKLSSVSEEGYCTAYQDESLVNSRNSH